MSRQPSKRATRHPAAPRPNARRAGGLAGRLVAIAAGLAILTLLVYAQAGSFGFLRYDDPKYVSDNVHVQHGVTAASLRWAFTTGHASNWHPVTWISHMLDWSWFGAHPGPMHLMSVALHLVTALLLLLVLHRMTGAVWRSAFVAAMFAVHPLHVESVAWLSERKDVLSGLFLMLTLLAYERWARRPRAATYALLLVAYALGLMSKPMLVTAPFLLLLLDAWPLRRWALPGVARTEDAPPAVPFGRLVLEKLPLLGLAVASSVVTYQVQRAAGSVAPLDRMGLDARLANAVVSCTVYALKTLWPSGLAPFYPWHERPLWETATAGAALALVTALALVLWRRRPYVAAGWFWFLGMLVPVIGIVQVGRQALADRYMYLPQIGLTVAIVWGVAELARAPRARTALAALAALVVAASTVTAWRQASYWKDGFALFGHAIQVTRDNYEAHTILGIEWHYAGDLEHALAEYETAMQIRSDYFLTHVNMGLCLAQLGRVNEALPHLREAIRLNPGLAEGHRHLGLALANMGQVREAEPELREAIRLEPTDAGAHYILGEVLSDAGRTAEARAAFEDALRLRPNMSEARAALRRLGQAGAAPAN